MSSFILSKKKRLSSFSFRRICTFIFLFRSFIEQLVAALEVLKIDARFYIIIVIQCPWQYLIFCCSNVLSGTVSCRQARKIVATVIHLLYIFLWGPCIYSQDLNGFNCLMEGILHIFWSNIPLGWAHVPRLHPPIVLIAVSFSWKSIVVSDHAIFTIRPRYRNHWTTSIFTKVKVSLAAVLLNQTFYTFSAVSFQKIGRKWMNLISVS